MTRQEYTALVDRAKQLSYEYYVLAQPTVSDAQFDALVSEIEQTESEHPEWTLADSPTQQVGSDLQDNGRRLVRHRTRMLSCQKAQTQEAVTKWLKITDKKLWKPGNVCSGVQYVLEWKLDGISCSLVYQDGVLVSAATRGDKDKGQDLLAHVMRMPSVPQHINMTGRVEVRGEIVCPKAALTRLGYKDCRTAAAALTNQVVPTDDMKQLEFVAWQMDSNNGSLRTEIDSLSTAWKEGFKTTVYKYCYIEKVLDTLAVYEQEREAYPYPTDGVVIKVDRKDWAASLGCTEHHPKGNIAYKFSAQKAITKVVRIEVSVGATGKRTPVAYLEPVMIMGREVKQASLYSERKMTELGVTEGCTVEVGLSNDVTPKIYRVIETTTETTTDGTEGTTNFAIKREQGDACINHAEREQSQDCESSVNYTNDESAIVADEPLTINPEPFARPEETLANARTIDQPRPRRQRKPRKSRVESEPATVGQEPITASCQASGATKNILMMLGGVMALSLVLFIVLETGLLIPLGLIGLATGGLLR